MAKKQPQKATTTQEPTVEVSQAQVVDTRPQPKTIEEPQPKDNWEFKDRTYSLKKGLSPLSYTLRCSDIYYFDKDKGYEREIKHTKNQKTVFVDEFQGDARLEHITFMDGVLFVPKERQTLQKLLSLYHPGLNKKYEEHKPVEAAQDEMATLELEIEALNAAQGLDIDMAEAVMRVEIGSDVSKISSKELRRDLLLYAKRNPRLFLDLVADSNIHLRNVGIKATELRIIKLSQDNRTFLWGSNDRKLMTVPFDEHPYSALAAWFKTDEGMEVLNTIEKRLS